MLKKVLQGYTEKYYRSSAVESYEWAAQAVASRNPGRVLDVGCGGGDTVLVSKLSSINVELFGVEGHPDLAVEAKAKGIHVSSFDLNGEWTYDDNYFDAVHSSQVIEHIHNTRLFLSEIYRVLVPGGKAILTSENLCSLLNLSAVAIGYTPFSLINVCGWYLGNPFGLHVGRTMEEHAGRAMPPVTDPAFSGVAGHIRVLSVPQAYALMEKTGFVDIEVRSIGLMPFPKWLGRPLESVMWRRGHWLLMCGSKKMQ